MASANYAIELKNISKSFGSIHANKNINLNVKQGEILALLGENGSGKTTLMNMLSGIYKPDEGHIYMNGDEVVINSPEDAKKLGIGMVHQHFKLVEVFSAADNICMGNENAPLFLGKKFSQYKSENPSISSLRRFLGCGKIFIKSIAGAVSNQFLKKNRYKEIYTVCDTFGFSIDATKKVYNMSVSEKQTLEIIKVLYNGANIIILDEPTAVLTIQEANKLFDVLRKMKAQGHSVIIITHKLNEVLDISDRVAIMRKGEYIGTVNTAETNEQQLTELMVGAKVDLNIEHIEAEVTTPLLEIRNLNINGDEGTTAIDDVNFYIRGGEILGVAGIAGCGQKELCEAIVGLRKIEKGKIIHKGENIVGMTPKQIIQKGISMSFIPEDRLGMGLAPSLSIVDNMLLKCYAEKPFNPFVDRNYGRAEAERVVKELSVATPSVDTPVRLLSGGNVQKVLIGREIKGDVNVIITAYPVRGLDVSSSYAIYDILNQQKKRGVGILFVGEDLDVMMSLCDKIMVLCHGKLMGIVHAHKTTKEQLGLMMTGALNISEINGKIAGVAKDTNIKE